MGNSISEFGKKLAAKVQYNAPVILTFALISLVALLLNHLTGGWSNLTFFSVYRSSWLNPLTYLRLFTHALGHQNFEHYFSNFTVILLAGPMLEEKYGSKSLLSMMAVTAGITGLINTLFFSTGLLGASRIAFMLILLSSFANAQRGKIPLTLIFAAVIYLGGEIADGLLHTDQISQLAHIVGGVCGCIFGMLLAGRQKEAS